MDERPRDVPVVGFPMAAANPRAPHDSEEDPWEAKSPYHAHYNDAPMPITRSSSPVYEEDNLSMRGSEAFPTDESEPDHEMDSDEDRVVLR